MNYQSISEKYFGYSSRLSLAPDVRLLLDLVYKVLQNILARQELENNEAHKNLRLEPALLGGNVRSFLNTKTKSFGPVFWAPFEVSSGSVSDPIGLRLGRVPNRTRSDPSRIADPIRLPERNGTHQEPSRWLGRRSRVVNDPTSPRGGGGEPWHNHDLYPIPL